MPEQSERLFEASCPDVGTARAVSAEAPRRVGRTLKDGSRALAILPGASLALLPVGLCPACWPAYAGLLSTLGLGFLLDSAYLLPLLISFLALALVTLAVGARGRRGYGPLALGALAAGLVLLGKFALASEAVLYPGLGLLIAASLWNSWPRKRDRAGTCGKCA